MRAAPVLFWGESYPSSPLGYQRRPRAFADKEEGASSEPVAKEPWHVDVSAVHTALVRGRGRSPRRFFGIAGTAIAIGLVVAVASWLLLGFSNRAQQSYDAALIATRLGTTIEYLRATEFQVDLGTARAGIDLRVGAVVEQANTLITELDSEGAAGLRLVSEFRDLRAALDTELAWWLRGDVNSAARVDRERVDPTFQRLQRDLDETTAKRVNDAKSASAFLRVGSAFVLLGAGALVGLIEWRSRRHAMRVGALSERTRVVAASERRFRALVNNGDDVIILTDRDGVIQEMSDSVNRVLGVSPEPRLGRKVTDLVHPDESIAVQAEFARMISTGSAGPSEWRCRDGDGAWRNVEVMWTNMLDLPEVAAVVLNVRDITERHRLEHELRHRAFHDSLTGLANRALLHDRIGHAMSRRETNAVALMVIDLDGFKHLNDSLGHQAGDQALIVVADRLLGVSRPGDTVARLGGDEFAILIEEAVTTDGTQAMGSRLVDAVSQPFEWEHHTIALGASVGIAFVEPGVRDADDLIRNADVGLYAAKESGRGRVCTFDVNLFDAARIRFELEHDLRQAVANHEFVLHYQPIVELEAGRPLGFEALIRWQHPTRGMIRPDEFIPIAEESDVIVSIGRWVLTQACTDLTKWTRTYPAAQTLYVSVNLSARQLEDVNIEGDVKAALLQAELDPARLILEITETALMHNVQVATERLNGLKALGVRLSVDDFGTGYSSLSYLRQFPIDTVKIDKSFIDDIATGKDDATFVEAILRLSEALNLDTLAEGIETKEQAYALEHLGCHLGQGFHYAKPLDPTDIEAFLNTYNSDSPARTL
jgi:diguanylate cyclase (GGDEF)-like protein/PAS domain S-box-containing protein